MKMKVLGVKKLICLLLSLTPLAENVHTRIMKCMRSEDCGEDYICSGGVCHNCFDCALLFREGPSCIVNLTQCGSCLKGYKDFPVTDFSTVIKPCKKIESKAYLRECLNDHHCPFDNYCHEKSCIKCFDCSLYNRLSPTQNCAKEPQDCSSCLNGFYEVPVTTETNTKPCQKIMSDSIQNVSLIGFFRSSYNVALVLLSVLEVLVIVTILIYRRLPGKSKKVIELQSHSRRPPPYPSDTFQYVREAEPEVEEESSFFTFVEEEKQQLNTAKVFRLPQAPYYYRNQNDVENISENHSEDEEEDVHSDSVDHGMQRQNNIPFVSNNTDSVTPLLEVDDFEVLSEPEINIATVSDVNLADSTSTDVTHTIEECTSALEESKNPDEGEGFEQREKKDLTK